MPVIIGILVGAFLGALAHEPGAIVGLGFIGGIIGLIVRVVRRKGGAAALDGGTAAGAANGVESGLRNPSVSTLQQRVTLLEARVQGLEMALLRVLGDAPP